MSTITFAKDFPAMLSADGIELLMDEHQLILHALDAFTVTMSGNGDDRAELARFVRFIREFADARHHGKEEDILYPMARMRLHEEALRGVDRDCAAFEARQVAAGADAVKELGRELVARHAPGGS